MTRILILEDEISLASHWKRLLEDTGHQVICVATAEEAIRQSSATVFDLLIADMLIKVRGEFTSSGGLTLIGKRATGHFPQIPIIGVSGFQPDPKHFPNPPLEIAQGMGVDIALYKPIRAPDLLQAVKQLLSQAVDSE